MFAKLLFHAYSNIVTLVPVSCFVSLAIKFFVEVGGKKSGISSL